jgi:hypothetical protein
MIHDPALALHTVKQSQQEHRDIATSHRLSRDGTSSQVRSTQSGRSPRRLLRLRRPAVASLGLRRHLSTP